MVRRLTGSPDDGFVAHNISLSYTVHSQNSFQDIVDDIVDVASELWDAGVDFFLDIIDGDDDDPAAAIIPTAPPFFANSPTTVSPTAAPTESIFGQQAAACSANSACMVFPGDCCPNELGQWIPCCDGTSERTSGDGAVWWIDQTYHVFFP